MNVLQHASAPQFLDRAGSWLLESEAENNLILGIASELVSDPRRFGPEDPYLVTVEQAGRVVGAALRTPPRPLILTRAPTPALEALARHALAAGIRLPGVNGPSGESSSFAERWAGAAGSSLRVGMRQRIYRCDGVDPSPHGPGRLRPATPAEKDLLVDWFARFHEEIGLDKLDYEAAVERRLEGRQLHVWEDGQIVSAATWMDTPGRGARLGFVYTPPGKRRKGYATGCVAALTRQLLEAGKRPVCLYADQANPTSNAIYQRIGYRAVCDWQEWHFEQASPSARRPCGAGSPPAADPL